MFRAFRRSLNAPRTNLAESCHSCWKNSGTVHLDLLDAARNLQLRANIKPASADRTAAKVRVKTSFQREHTLSKRSGHKHSAMSFLGT